MKNKAWEKAVDSYFDKLLDGLPREELIATITKDGDPELLAIIIDVECDPIRISFELSDGFAAIQTADWQYVLLTPRHLETLAKLSRQAKEVWDQFYQQTDFENITDEDKAYWLTLCKSSFDFSKQATE